MTRPNPFAAATSFADNGPREVAPVTINAPEDYTKIAFPYDTTFENGEGHIRLYGAMSGKVFGITYHRQQNGNEHFSQALDWQADGAFGERRGEHGGMDLPPAPSAALKTAAHYHAQLTEAKARLDTYPDAPVKWREGDEQIVTQITARLEKLAKGMGVDVAEMLARTAPIAVPATIAASALEAEAL